MSLIFITGGVRSGKSDFAESLVKKYGEKVLYIATGIVYDNEMQNRIELHKQRRPSNWETIEETTDLCRNINQYSRYDAILIDCLSSLISNQMIDVMEENIPDDERERLIIEKINRWVGLVTQENVPVIIVTNETGLGGVALTPLGRWFQDILGKANQIVASHAHEAYIVISGIPMELKKW